MASSLKLRAWRPWRNGRHNGIVDHQPILNRIPRTVPIHPGTTLSPYVVAYLRAHLHRLSTQLEAMDMEGVNPVSEGLKGWWTTYGVHSVWSGHYRTVSFQMLWAILPNAFGFSNDEGVPIPELWFLPYAFFVDMAQYVQADRREGGYFLMIGHVEMLERLAEAARQRHAHQR